MSDPIDRLRAGDISNTEIPGIIVELVQCQPNLLHVICAFCSTSRFANRLHSGQQQPDEDCNNCDYYEQLDECERTVLGPILCQVAPRLPVTSSDKFAASASPNLSQTIVRRPLKSKERARSLA